MAGTVEGQVGLWFADGVLQVGLGKSENLEGDGDQERGPRRAR